MNHKKNGFTLIEMVVTLAVLSILLSVSVFSLVSWQENMRFTQQNEYAQTLFVAAQNQLTEYSRNGRLDEFAASLLEDSESGTYYRELDVTTLTDSDGNAYDLSQVWPESAKDGISNPSAYRTAICYASCMEGDYAAYQEGGYEALSQRAKDSGADVVFELLSSYVYDQSILNNSISIEFTPEEGQVFSVLFRETNATENSTLDTSKCVEFTYGTEAVSDAKGMDITNREESYRREKMIGYYGADTLSKATTAEVQKPKLAQVKLNNEETLNLSFKVQKVVGAAQQLQYTLNVYDKDTKQQVLSIRLDGTQIQNYASRDVISCPVTRYVHTTNTEGEAVTLTQELGDYDILAWIEDDETVRLVLDAADIQATSSKYLSDLESGNLKGEDAAGTAMATTYSFHRFGLDA
jgi:prepilin-type N-terminal cleavage/methylation domain-containing protein